MAIPIKVVENELIRAYGNITVAAKNLGISRQALYNRIKKNKTLQKARVTGDYKMIDAAHNSLVAAAARGEPWAVKFVLTTKGAKEGFVPVKQIQQEVVKKKKAFSLDEKPFNFNS